jgi:hypothetical protein
MMLVHNFKFLGQFSCLLLLFIVDQEYINLINLYLIKI